MFTFLFCVFVTLSIFLISKHLNAGRQRNLPPSPAVLPVLGHLHLLKPAAHRVLRALSNKHGPIMYLYFGRIPVVVVTSPSLAEECFNKNDAVFANRPISVASKILGYNSTTIGFAPYGDHWRNLRRLTTVHIFSSTSLQQTSATRCGETRFLIKKMLEGSDHETWKKVNLKSLFFELVYNVAMVMIVGERGVVMDEMFGPSKLLDVCDYIPLFKWIDVLGIQRRMESLNKKRDGFLQDLIDSSRSKFAKSSPLDENKTYIERLLLMQQDEPDYYTDEILKGLIQNMFTAGTHTVALTMEWVMSLLLNHPHELDKARKEIANNLPPNKFLEESDLQKLPYLRCIIYETLRLYPIGPLLVPHCSSSDCSVGAFDIPKGTTLLVNVWAIQRDPNVWEDPETFNPERFLGFEGGYDGFRFVPFGAGRRACPGAGMAMRLMGLVLGSFVQCFDWKRVGSGLVDMEEIIGLTLSKKKPLEAMCRPTSFIMSLHGPQRENDWKKYSHENTLMWS